MPRLLKTVAALVPLVLVTACTDAAKAPAEAAMKAADAAVATLQGEATRYVPDGVAAVQKSLASAKEMIAREDYKGALAAAGEIPAKVKVVLALAAAKKDELVKAFDDVAGKLPDMLAAIKSRLGILAQSKKLPAGLDKAALAKANEGTAALESGWQKVQDEFKGGNLRQAIAGAKDLQAKGAEIMKAIGLQ
jgi:hypothetical protein